VQPLREKFNQRCTTVAHVDFCDSKPSNINIMAGGFGRSDEVGSQFGAVVAAEDVVLGSRVGGGEVEWGAAQEGAVGGGSAGVRGECRGWRHLELRVLLRRGDGCRCSGAGRALVRGETDFSSSKLVSLEGCRV
jgi:outer membrane lipoprotein SlyB